MTFICGVEEAGRGPVLGPMSMAICWGEDEEVFRKAGAKDSKLLTPLQRERVLENLEALEKSGKIGFALILLQPGEIDAAVEGEHDNLNKLEVRTTARLIKKALAKAAIKKAYLDCPTVSTEKYAAEVRLALGDAAKDLTIISENKADVTYPVVSAASIVAKVTRDKEVRKLEEKFKVKLGSGYPADPHTKRFLAAHHANEKYASMFRKSWATYKNAKQQTLFHFNQESKKSARQEQQHNKEIKEFEVLKKHGFAFVEPKGEYEIVRMKGAEATITKYTTGKVLVQGKGKQAAEEILRREGLQ